MKPRHVPMRTCAGCRETRAKRDLVRVVRLADGAVAVDETGKRAGRGTYLCGRQECWAQALRSGSLARVLRTAIRDSDLASLRSYAERFASQG